jgi:3-hydroxybutyryl-CoA dehydratase
MAGRRQKGGWMNSATTQLFLEDFHKGQIFPGRQRKITKADVLSFAALTDDKHPLHYDDAYAKTTRFGRPIVHGLHLMALTALGAAPLSEQLTDSMIAFLEQHALFQKPVFKDDTVRSEFEIEGADRQPGKEWGKLTIKVRLINQRDEIVIEGRHVYRLRSRADAKLAGGR